MQKSLKKSLYLGLAALSFASVAGATNANAAKKHSAKKAVKAVKPVTYTSSYNLDQSVVYSLNGSNAIYTKPGTVKGARVVASKSDVKSVANSSKGYFMAYGEAKTSKGVHYYKVVSFDKKYRGWVYAGSAKKVDATTNSTSNPSNTTVYLKGAASNGLWNAPKYSAFKTSKSVANNNALRNDAFTVDKTVKLAREGWTYYHVTDQKDSSINGWIFAGAVDVKPDNTYFNSTTDIQLNFTSNGSSVYKKVVKISDLNKISGYSDTYNRDSALSTNASDKLISRVDDALKSASADFNKDKKYNDFTSYFDNNANTLKYVKTGDVIDVPLTPVNASSVNFALASNGQSISAADLSLPKVTKSQSNSFMSNGSDNSNRQLVALNKTDASTNFTTSTESTLFNDNIFKTTGFTGLNNTLGVIVGKGGTIYSNSGNNVVLYKASSVLQGGDLPSNVSDSKSKTVDTSQVTDANSKVTPTNTLTNGDAVAVNGSDAYTGNYYKVYVLNKNVTESKNANKHYGDALTLYYDVYNVAGNVKANEETGTYYTNK